MKVPFINRMTALLALSCLTLSLSAHATAPHSITFSEDDVKASFALAPDITVDITVEFDDVIGLNANNLSIEADLVSNLDYSVTSRLPLSGVSLDTGFPVVVSISPDPDSGFAFEGVATVEIYTKAIHYDQDIPRRLYSSHAGGAFEDITTMTSSGSFRARGSTGKFSDFIIVLDNRSVQSVIADKTQRMAAILDTISDTALISDAELLSLAVMSQDYNTALSLTDSLIKQVEGDTSMPAVWHADDSITNTYGELLTALKTLRYSLRVQ